MADRLDIDGFEYDDSLATQRRVFVVLKGTGQLAIVEKIIERKGNKRYGLTAVTNVAERRYSEGLIALTGLDRDTFDEDTLAIHLASTEPYEIAVDGDRLAYTSGYRFGLLDLATGTSADFTSDWMSYLHTIEFSEDGQRVLVAATGLDTILEIELGSSDVIWDWNAWDHGINHVTLTDSYLSRDRDQAKRLEEGHPGAEVRLIEDPLTLPREGLATHHSPMNLNGAHYGRDGQILATGYHRPELFVIDRDGAHERHDLGLTNPHSFRPCGEGYMVADTGSGRLLLLDDDFAIDAVIDVSSLPADAEKKAGFGEWMQTASPLGESGLFAVVDALRNGVHIVDVPGRRRRFIPNPPEWTIQAVIDAPIDAELFTHRMGMHTVSDAQ